MKSRYGRTSARGRYDGGPSPERVLVLAKEDQTSEAGDAGDVLVESMTQMLADVVEGYAAPPPVLDEGGRVLAAFEVITLEPAKLGLLEDVVSTLR